MLKITPTPWKVRMDGGMPAQRIVNFDERHIGDTFRIGDVQVEARNNAEAIVSAINNTYGKGIRPESIPFMVDALNSFIEWAEKHAMWDKSDQSYYKAKKAISESKL